VSTMPPQKDEPDDMDAEYRRWSTNDTARPSDSVRSAVLAHAATLAAKRRTSLPLPSKSKRGVYRWAAPVFGGLAAATLVGFLVIPRLSDPGQQADKAAGALMATDAQPAAPRQAAPAASPAPAPELVPAPAIAANSAPAPSEAKSRAKRASPPAPSAESVKNLDEIVVTESNARRSRQVLPPGGSMAGQAADSAASARPASAAPPAAHIPQAAFSATSGSLADPGAELRRSANLGDLPGVAALLGGKVDIESRDSAGRTALLLAASNGRAAVVTALLARGADPNATDSYGDTPLHAALAGNHVEIANALKRAGAR
jgi:Ankyrin repeats (3 copies)